MNTAGISRIVIAGGGTAGWMTAAAMARVFSGTSMQIELVESEDIGIVGVGEATIPEILKYNAILGIDEATFMRETQATFKLGIEFHGWLREGERYFHPFGRYGVDMEGISFHHFWLKAKANGYDGPLEDFCITWQAGKQGRFAHPSGGPNSPLHDMNYAYHFDAVLYGQFLRRYAQNLGVRRTEGRIVEVKQNSESGNISSVVVDGKGEIAGDLFIDCTGFHGLLIEKTLKSGYDDWSHYLPCNSAVAVPCEHSAAPALPFTKSTARDAGWQWRIPLQHRVGNGYVYSNQHVSDDEAAATLLAGLDGKPLADVRQLRFVTGKRREVWKKNCIAIGLSSGFLEPLESTSIHLIQSCITKLITLFPTGDFNEADRRTYNRLVDDEFLTIRNFLILHYNATERSGRSFWDYVRTMDVPDFLKDKRALFENAGRVFREENEIFTEPSWLAVYTGQGVMPRAWHPIADVLSNSENIGRLSAIRDTIGRAANSLPPHKEYMNQIGATAAA
jgi:tryptophan 7-halogenase